jgi:peptidyl-prolyl cis-trans isomerase A (cyclophilin A)
VLNGELAPITVKNFLHYAKEGFYDGTIFHRVIPTFMCQGGGFTPDLEEKKEGLGEPIKNEWGNGLKNDRGTIAMARTTDPDSATAQFFINVVDNDRLDQPISGGAGYAVFGRVAEGMDVVDKIKNTSLKVDPKYPSNDQPVVPVEPIVIKSIKPVEGEAASAAREKVAKAWEEAKAAKEKADREKNMAKEAFEEKFKELKAKGQKTESGLVTLVTQEGTGDVTPKPTDRVTVHYTGWLTNGEKFDSSVDRGAPATFPLSNVIKGWTEGVGLMKVGEKRLLLIPFDLAYGEQGRPPVIPARAELVFEVELLKIN